MRRTAVGMGKGIPFGTGGGPNELYLDPNLFLRLDETMGITPDEASIDPDLTNWTNDGIASFDDVSDPAGGTDAQRLTSDSSVGFHRVYVLPTSLANNRPGVVQFYARKVAGSDSDRLIMIPSLGGTSTGIDLSDGSVTGGEPADTVVAIGDDWWLVTLPRDPQNSYVELRLTDSTYDPSWDGAVSTTIIDIYGSTLTQSRIGVQANQANDGVVEVSGPTAVPASYYDVGQTVIDEQPLIPGVYDGSNDNLVSDMATKLGSLEGLRVLHGGSVGGVVGCTVYGVMTFDDVTSLQIIFGTSSIGTADLGFAFAVTSNSLRAYVLDGSGTDRPYLLNASGALPATGKYAFAVAFDGTDGQLYVQDAEADSKAITGGHPLAGTTDPDDELHVGWRTSATLAGSVHEVDARYGKHSSDAILQNLAYLRAKHGIS